MADTHAFDYKKLNVEGCDMEVEYETPNGLIGGECGKPAIYTVWWEDMCNGVEYHSEMSLCEEHFQMVKAKEAADEAK